MPEPLLLTVPDVAAVLSVSQRTVEKLIAGRELPVVRLGRSVRIRANAVEAYILRLERSQDGERQVSRRLAGQLRRVQ